MNEEKDNYRDEEILEAVNRFRRSLISGRSRYFDVSEFEGIVEQLLEEGDIQASEIAAKQGIKIHPNSIPLQLKYAQILINKGLYEKALDYIKAAEKVDSNNADVHLLKGSALTVLGKEKEGMQAFKKAIILAGPDLDEVYYQIGSTYIQTGKITKALYYFEKTFRINPDHDMALYDLGYFYDQQENLNKSIKYYNLYLDIDPFNQYVWFNLGTIYNKTGEYDKAVEAYEYAYTINSGFLMALLNIGNTLANAGKYTEAVEKYHEYLVVNPDSDEAYCYLGECFLNLEDYDEARLKYKRALDININNDAAWFGIGLIFWIEQNLENAIRYIQKAIKIDSTNPEYWLTVAKIHNDNNDYDAAVVALKNAARLEVSNTEIWLTWADVYENFDEADKALRILKKGITKNNDPLLKYRLVAVLLKKRKTKEALKVLEEALEQDIIQLSFLHDIYPNSIKNKRVNQLISDFLEKNNINLPDEDPETNL